MLRRADREPRRRWRNGTPPGGSTQTQAWDINNSGQIVGEYLDCSGDSHGFLLNGGVFTTIDFPAAQCGLGGDFAEGINDASQISGRYCAITGCNGYYFDGTTYSALAVGPGNTVAFIILLTWRKHG